MISVPPQSLKFWYVVASHRSTGKECGAGWSKLEPGPPESATHSATSRYGGLTPPMYDPHLLHSNPAAVFQLCEKSRMSPHPASRQIQLDLHRTLTTNQHFSSPSSSTLQQLRRVLLAFSWQNPAVGYCQGLNRYSHITEHDPCPFLHITLRVDIDCHVTGSCVYQVSSDRSAGSPE